MIDKIIFNSVLECNDDIFNVIEKNGLVHCAEGKRVFYQSPEHGKFEGIYIKVSENKVKVSCSLHKLFYKKQTGSLDNTGVFSLKQAYNVAVDLLNKIGLDRKNTRVTYYEIGLNMRMSEEPIKYIEEIQSIACSNTDREMFNDANYKKSRQKTTEKSKNIRRVFKIYDKDYEVLDRKRIAPSGLNNLRIETVCKRQSIMFNDFFETKNLKTLKTRFWGEWDSSVFERVLSYPKGTKKSVKDKARSILLHGKDVYLSESKALYRCGALSKMEMQTIREFCAKWDSVKHLYSLIGSDLENDFRYRLNLNLTVL